ncbi:MAG TPA: glycoside hydrolase family 16 protein [Bradyrhizobium sp.]|uniref:glycoside hydrolase family 16 protein n=1 Tax=Bradyrhizobium sp. TaxID=376 RepID=UPI002C527C43|nr:glycoside hydrolase family 16 protein [Bradyrhizobium sp.]HLZ06025.1 glycoside hydrolase family 16 protein [Bradyrhizobium sp.]
MRLKLLVLIGCLVSAPPTFAQDPLADAPRKLSLAATREPVSAQCRRVENAGPSNLAPVVLRRTFNDDFNVHPLAHGRWVPHYAGGAMWPEAQYWGGSTSQLRRQTKPNGEQQIYVDPRYAGLAKKPLGLNPFRVRNGVLSIVASRTPPELKPVLFNNAYISGILTTQGWFSQKYGYFEIRAKVPVGTGVWPAFWMLADDGGWPPEIDVLEGRGQRPGDLVMTTHWRIPTTQKIESCGFDFQLADAALAFHNYGMLWAQDRIIYFIDRKPVSDIKVPIGFDDPMYMIVNLAMGSKWFGGVGVVDGESPEMVEFQIDRISAYQIDPFQPYKPPQPQGAQPIKASFEGESDAR